MHPRFIWFLSLALALALPSMSHAHPVSQGAMEVSISPERIELRARVATEEVFVRRAFTPAAAQPASIDTAWQDHGQYLLKHIRVFADGQLLAGRFVKAEGPPANVAPSQPGGDRLNCQFEYPLTAGAHPTTIKIEEDILNEFDYVPGNRWEASYVVRIGQVGHTFEEGRLLTSKDPLDFRCEWPAADQLGAPAQMNAAASTDRSAGLDRWRLVKEYVHHGIMHILTGYDHLLFISALALATLTFLDLVKVISAFTLAHTVTLTLATLNIVRLPSAHRGADDLGEHRFRGIAKHCLAAPEAGVSSRLLIAFFFGLFHGLGFAGGLLEAMEGLPGMAVWLAIAAFSLGVELGHQVVVLPLFFGLRWARESQPNAIGQAWVSKLAMRFGSTAIALAGTYYLVIALRVEASANALSHRFQPDRAV